MSSIAGAVTKMLRVERVIREQGGCLDIVSVMDKVGKRSMKSRT
jgi:hypothetical protein